MTKQEDIREGLEEILLQPFDGICTSSGVFTGYQHSHRTKDDFVRMILDFLHSKGVVIKADRELPDTNAFIGSLLKSDLSYEERVEALKKHIEVLGLAEAGSTAIEPLIGGDK